MPLKLQTFLKQKERWDRQWLNFSHFFLEDSTSINGSTFLKKINISNDPVMTPHFYADISIPISAVFLLSRWPHYLFSLLLLFGRNIEVLWRNTSVGVKDERVHDNGIGSISHASSLLCYWQQHYDLRSYILWELLLLQLSVRCQIIRSLKPFTNQHLSKKIFAVLKVLHFDTYSS